MKTKLLFSLVIFLTVAAFIFEKKSESRNNTYIAPPLVSTDSEFLINVMQSGIDYNYSEYPDLNTNAWHIYCGSGPSGGWPGVSNDDIFHFPGEYGSGLIAKIEENRSHGFRSIMERPRTVHLGYSQRSEYQCETLSVGADYWFYAYNTHQTGIETNDYAFNGNGARVRYCQANPGNPGSNAGYVAKDLRSNREQANKLWTPMHNDDTYEWFVMPRIRIDSAFVDNFPNSKVCAIIMLDWNGDTIRSVDILASYFLDQNSNYNGNYIEEYSFPDTNLLEIPPGVICPGFAKHFWDWTSDDDTNTIKTDFRVYWYGLCDMWIDYVRVENEPAHQFFDSTYNWDEDVRAEADFALSGYDPDHPIPNNFYLEEFEFNMVPSIKHFNELVRDQTGNKISMMVNLNYSLFKVHIPNAWATELSPAQIDDYLVNRADIKYAVVTCYPLEGFPESSRRQSYHPVTLSTEQYNKEEGILSYPASVTNYEDSLQKQLDLRPDEGFIKILSKADSLTKIATDLNIILLEQAHLHFAPTHMLKEPSNEEMKLMSNIAITYGAKGIMYFAYNSENDFSDTAFYQRGLVERITLLPRTQSVYGQNKWESVNEINTTIRNWSPYIMSFENDSRKSYILRIERDNLVGETFFNDVITYKPFGNTPPCVEDDPGSNPSGIVYECKEDRYLQVATFQNTEPNTKYFMVVNRRCSPFLNDSTNNDNNGGRRFVRILFDSGSSSFSGFNNWSVIDVSNDSLIKTFDKKARADINLEWYLPGEGKLYKIAPVMQEGGALVADEECVGDIECKGEVNNNGKNIFLKPGTNISFTDHTARIKMTGGVFKSGYSQTQNTPVYLKGMDNNSWKGISLYGCDSVLIKDTHFSNISPYPVDSTYAVDMINCKFINIETGSFVSEGSLNAGCIRSGYVINGDFDYSACIQGNTFETDEGEIPALSFIATAGLTLPLIIDGNIFTSASSEGSSNAVLLSNISGGVIKNNTVSEYINSIIMLSSSMDLYNNMITSDINNSAGLQIYSFGTAYLKPSGMYFTGGYNNFSNLGDGSKNIELLTSYFNIYKGYNVFNVESNSDYHLIGSVYLSYLTNPTQNAKLNCFQFDGTNTPENQALVWDNSGMTAEYIFTPYSCEIEEPIAYEVFNIANRINDTIYYEQTGTGGGNKNLEFGMSDLEFEKNIKKKIKNENIELESMELLESLIDSIGINIRRRNYEKVSEDCMNILTNYPDSLESIGIISKLYLAELRLDSGGNKITGLKTFLETLILNHPNNTALVKQAFYYIQKCKVSLKQYESAMTGFLEIMDENPYSYEGLVASWDFSATSLLFEGGSGAGNSNYELGIKNYELKENEMENSEDEKSQIRNSKSQISKDGSREDERENSDDEKSQIRNSKSQILNDGSKEDERENGYEVKFQIRNSKSQILNDDPNDKYDKKTFTGEDRKIIRENVFNIFETSKEIEIEKVKSLEKKFEEGKASKEERAELEKKKTLSETIKARKPADAFEHIKFVNNDIQKVFGVTGRGSEKESKNIIPNEYSLSQNYPNPFNPITHLEFGISNLGFVTLKVYDMLGREVKTLLNEIKPAGTYKIEFDGSNFASGVYFYRIEAGDFVQTKRMVLIK